MPSHHGNLIIGANEQLQELRGSLPSSILDLLARIIGEPLLPCFCDSDLPVVRDLLRRLLESLDYQTCDVLLMLGDHLEFSAFLAKCDAQPFDSFEWAWGAYLSSDFWTRLLNRFHEVTEKPPNEAARRAFEVHGIPTDYSATKTSLSSIVSFLVGPQKEVPQYQESESFLHTWFQSMFRWSVEAALREGVPTETDPIRCVLELQRLGIYPGGEAPDGTILAFALVSNSETSLNERRLPAVVP